MIDFDALEAANEPLNAFSDFDRTAAFGEGPLAGLAIGVKANIAVAGMPWHAGLAAFETRLAERDADTVALLRQAGAAIIGVLNMEEAALGAKTDNPHFGPVHNPHRAGFSPGGSSGGSGAAVAAGLCDAALGTDTMGSIRIPAAQCGVYGFKPATASVSQEGLEPADLTLDAIGPLARDLDTLERVARVISGFGDDPLAGPGAMLVEHGVEVHPDVVQTFDAALEALGQPPVRVALSHLQSRIRFAGFIGVSRELAAHLAGVTTSERLAKLLTYGPRRSLADWAEDRDILARTRDEVRAVVEEHGFLILPTVPNPPFAHAEAEPAAQADFTCLANIAGLPALSLPAGWTADGLPIGVQIVAPAGAEAGLFALARHLDRTLRAYRPPQTKGARAMRIICLFNLKPGVDVAEYEAWAKTRDLPTVNALGSVTSFTVHKATGVFGDDTATPAYQYIEVIDITGMDAFVADISTVDFQAAAAPFQGFADAPQFILTEDL